MTWPRRWTPRSRSCWSRSRPELEPHLLPEGPLREHGMRFLLRLREADRVVDSPGALQRAVGPEHHPPVVPLAGELDAAADQPAADPMSARVRVDEEQSQLRDLLGAARAVDGPDPTAVQLADPGRLALGVVIVEVVRDHAGYKRDERLVPALLVGVEVGVTLEHPAVIAQLGLPDLDAFAAADRHPTQCRSRFRALDPRTWG